VGLPANAKSTCTTFDPPESMYTYPVGIAAGTIAGYYQDSAAALHGFVRRSGGTITTFDPSCGSKNRFAGDRV
jgi:hypothetical protein